RNQPGAGQSVAISGHSLDGSGFGRKDNRPASEKAAPSNEPFHLSVKVDRLVLRDGVMVAPFSLDASGAGRAPQSLTASGGLGKGATLSAGITAAEGKRRLTISAGDAGLMIRGLLGYQSIKGGELAVQANMSAGGTDARKPAGVSDYTGELT